MTYDPMILFIYAFCSSLMVLDGILTSKDILDL